MENDIQYQEPDKVQFPILELMLVAAIKRLMIINDFYGSRPTRATILDEINGLIKNMGMDTAFLERMTKAFDKIQAASVQYSQSKRVMKEAFIHELADLAAFVQRNAYSD